MHTFSCRAVSPLAAVAMSLGLTISAQATSNDDPLVDVYKLPVWIDGVTRVCPWKSAAGQGYVRLIRTDRNSHHGLYLQWIRKGIAGATTQATSTILVEELESDYLVRMEMPQAQLEPNACRLSALAESITTERRYQFDFVVKGPGDYTLSVTHLLEGGL
jgi:hypothetical protein